MIYFILGFLSWPLVGFIYIGLRNLYISKTRRDKWYSWDWYYGFLGLVPPIVDIHDYFIKDNT